MSAAPGPASAAAGSATGSATGTDDVWAWLARRRQGAAYQPDPEDGGDDPNGCLPKLRLLLECGYDLSGRSLLSLGASSALYEAALAHQARRGACGQPAPGMSAAHLVDTDAGALEQALARFDGAGVGDLRTIRALAHELAPERRYDACFFLSLFHHYDRLGPRLRARGFEVLATIGQHCRTLFFETGQTGDTVPGAEEWPALLEMAAWPSPTAWLEARVPELTGYDAFRRLGTNPRTGRHLYAFWRARPLTGLGSGPGIFSALRDGDAAGDVADVLDASNQSNPSNPSDASHPSDTSAAPAVNVAIRVEMDDGGDAVCVLPGGGCVPLETAVARAAGRALWVDVGSADGGAVPAPALARVAETLRAARLAGCVLQLRQLEEIDAVPAGVDVCWAADAACEAGVRGVLATAALSGVPLVSLPGRWNTAAVLDVARAEGVRLAFGGTDGVESPSITLTPAQP